MPHHTHKMNAYRDCHVWASYCEKCSAEDLRELEQECPGKYNRKFTSLLSKVEENNRKSVSERECPGKYNRKFVHQSETIKSLKDFDGFYDDDGNLYKE